MLIMPFLRLNGQVAQGKPVMGAHVDYTPKSGPSRLWDLLPEEAESLQKTPYAVVQVNNSKPNP